MVVAFGGVPKFARWPGLIGMALNGFGSLRDSSSNFDLQKKFVFFVFFVEKNRTLISDLTQSNFKVLLRKYGLTYDQKFADALINFP